VGAQTGDTAAGESKCLTPTGSGVVDVAVERLGQWRRQTVRFTYFDEPATIKGVSPGRGPRGGGYVVQISGTGLGRKPSVTIGWDLRE
jgi:hypothetical protein